MPPHISPHDERQEKKAVCIVSESSQPLKVPGKRSPRDKSPGWKRKYAEAHWIAGFSLPEALSPGIYSGALFRGNFSGFRQSASIGSRGINPPAESESTLKRTE